MRKDFPKVLVECYRFDDKWNGPRRKFQRQRVDKALDEFGGKLGMKHIRTVLNCQSKSFGENLGPLYRFIRNKVGHKWDNVYSEICEVCKRDGAVQNHIFSHLWDYVTPAEKVVFKEGVPGEFGYGGWAPLAKYRSFDAMYVDPKDGIIKIANRVENYYTTQRRLREERKAHEAAHKVVVNKHLEYHKWYIHGSKSPGIWFRLTIDDVPPPDVFYEPPPGTSYFHWKTLSKVEQKLHGRKVERPTYVTDVFWNGKVMSPGGKLAEETKVYPTAGTKAAGPEYNYRTRRTNEATRYYSSCKQLSKREMKRLGLK